MGIIKNSAQVYAQACVAKLRIKYTITIASGMGSRALNTFLLFALQAIAK